MPTLLCGFPTPTLGAQLKETLMSSVRVIAFGTLFALAPLGCATEHANVTAPSPGPGFPNSESFYPVEALRSAQQGLATVHVCVDAQGKLSHAASLAASSGIPALDVAAIEVATAGSGHYTAGTRNGVSVPGCVDFRVNFRLNTDPRWPNLSRKLSVLNAEYRVKAKELSAEISALTPPTSGRELVPGDKEDLKRLRQLSAAAPTMIDRQNSFVTGYIDGIERLSSSGDVPESERRAWAETWPARRLTYEENYRELRSALLNIADIGNELADYMENARPPLIGPSGPVPPTPQQRSDIDALMERGRAAQQRLVEATGVLTASARQLYCPE